MTGRSRKKRLYYGPWKVRRHEPVSQIVFRLGPQGEPNIEVESYKESERHIGPGVSWTEARKEERDRIPLKYMLEKLKLKDADYNLLNLMKGGVEVIFKMATLYHWYLIREEEKQRRPEIKERERLRREKERDADRRYRAARKAELKKERLKKLKEKKEKAAKEKALRLEAKKREAEEKAKKKKLEDQIKADAAAKKLKEEEEARMAKEYAESWVNPPKRRMEL